VARTLERHLDGVAGQRRKVGQQWTSPL
jgi:hypothetical protein